MFFKKENKAQGVQEDKNKLVSKLLNSSGFSLIEILIALTLLAIAGTFVVGQIFENLKEGQIEATNIQLKSLEGRLNEFRRHCNRYPTTEQGLDALISKPSGGKECKRYRPGGYLTEGEVPLDPWEEPYVYESDGRTIKLYSFGPDTLEGTEDDIYLYKKNKPAGSEEFEEDF